MDDFYTRRDTSSIAPLLFRLAVIAGFIAIVFRLYDLQVLQSERFRAQAERNRTRIVETLPPRGVIYDVDGKILTRNNALFEVAVIPDGVVYDDDLTEDVDEEREALGAVLESLNVRGNTNVSVRIAEAMLRRLGRCDYVEALEDVAITPRMIRVPAPTGGAAPVPCDPQAANAEAAFTAAIGDESSTQYVEIPDTDSSLPLAGLEALLRKAVAIQRLGQASEPIPILTVSSAVAFDVMEASYQLPSVVVREVPIRRYIYGEELSHVLGFMGAISASSADDYREEGYLDLSERVGVSGIEYSYQNELRGIPGKRQIEVNILGKEVGTVDEPQEPIPGQHVYLTLKLEFQRTMHRELQAMLDEKGSDWGVTIAMDPMTGKILGMVSLPSFDNGIFNGEIGDEYFKVFNDPRRPLNNYAISSFYPPGSVFKMVVAAGALQENVVTESTVIRDDGPIYLPNRFAPDNRELAQRFVSWNHNPSINVNHGPLMMAQAIAWSNDIYFYWIGGGFPKTDSTERFVGLGEERMVQWSRQFGYGEPTGIDIPGETGGNIPTGAWKRRWFAQNWTTGDSYNMSIGQGFVAVTPLQVLVATSAIVNGGKVLNPQLVDRITDINGEVQRTFTPSIACDLTQPCENTERFSEGLAVSPSNLDIVRLGMWEAVNTKYGTSVDARIDGIVTAGKTGTAEFCKTEAETGLEDCGRDDDGNLPTHSWYVGYAPYDAPEIAVVTFIHDGGEGSEAALPVTRRVMEAYFGIQPDVELAQTE